MVAPDKSYAIEQRLNLLWASQPQVTRLAAGAGQLINSATPASILTVASPLKAGPYAVTGDVFYNPGATAAGAAIFSWSVSVTVGAIRILFREEKGYSPNSGTTALPSATLGGFVNFTSFPSFTGGTMAANSVCRVSISGALDVTVAGTVALQAACTVPADTYTVLYGSWLTFVPQF